MGKVILSLFAALVLTCITESLPHLFFKERTKWLVSGLLCNIVTNPLLNVIVLFLYAFVDNVWQVYAIILLLETAVLFTEACLYKLMLDKPYKTCLTVSALCNGISCFIGVILNLIQ